MSALQLFEVASGIVRFPFRVMNFDIYNILFFLDVELCDGSESEDRLCEFVVCSSIELYELPRVFHSGDVLRPVRADRK